LTSPALETEAPLRSYWISPLIIKPPVPLAIVDSSIVVLSILPKTT
jgi:hypothetical protein